MDSDTEAVSTAAPRPVGVRIETGILNCQASDSGDFHKFSGHHLLSDQSTCDVIVAGRGIYC